MKLSLGPLLKRLDIKQARLAEMADLSPGYVSSIVSGHKKPSLQTLENIADVLGVQVAALYSGTDERESVPNRPPVGLSEDAIAFIEAPPNESLSPSHHEQFLVAKVAVPSLCILQGDIIHVDLQSRRTRGIAVVTRADTETGHAQTLLRHVEIHGILPAIPGQPIEPFSTEHTETSVLGWVTRITRSMLEPT